MKLSILFFVCFCVGIGTIPAAELSNGTFEAGSETGGAYHPTGWTPPPSGGNTVSPGYQSKWCVSAAGDGSTDGVWASDPVAVNPGECYEFSFWGREEEHSKGGCALSGAEFCNRDFDLKNAWEKYSFVFRVPDKQAEARFRVGQWCVRGQNYFDGVQVTPVQPVYNQRGDLELGRGEKIEGGRYDAEHLMASKDANTCRFLESANVRFNSSRWIFAPSSYVIYQHELPGNRMSQGTVSVNINLHTDGVLKASVRGDDKQWIELGTLNKSALFAWDLPTNVQNSQKIEVKLEGIVEGEKGCNFQIDQYHFLAKLQTPVDDMQGDTHYARILQTDPRIRVKIADTGNPKPGIPAQYRFTLTNLFDREKDFSIHLDVTGEKSRDRVQRVVALKPQETKTISIPYTISESGEPAVALRVTERTGASLFEGQISFQIPLLFSADYGDLIESDRSADVWWCPSGYKISQNRPAPKKGKKTVEFSAARGEFEPVQIVLRPNRSLANVKVECSDLKGPSRSIISKQFLSVKQVEYVKIDHPSDSWGCVGWWPDPLPPVEAPLSLERDRNYPFWITVFVPRDAKAGAYSGCVRFSADDWEAEIPIHLRVFDFEIPKTFSVRSAFGFNPEDVRRYHHLETEDELKQVVDLYYQNFRDHRISPYNPTSLYPIRHQLTDRFTFDFTEFDKAGEKYFDEYGFTSLHLPLVGMGGGTFHDRQKGKIGEYEQGTPEHERLFKEYASTVEKHLREKGWLDKAFVYWFDEPEQRDYEFVKEGMDMIHRNAPGLKRFLTEQPEKALLGAVEIWCPILDAYDPEFFNTHRSQGEEIWWYICTGPKQPYPGLFIDHPITDLRAWLWMTHKFGIKGCLVWASNYWTSDLAFPEPNIQDPWSDPMSYVTGYGNPVGYRGYWGNGDGRFIYPPKNWKESKKLLTGPVDSIRWEMLREGMEDFEYFALIQAKLEVGELTVKQADRARELLSIPEGIVKSRTEYAKDSQLLYDYREKLAEFIERVSEK